VTVFIAELETGEHRHLKVTLPSAKPITEADKDATIAWLQKRCALLDSLLGECLRHITTRGLSSKWTENRGKLERHGERGNVCLAVMTWAAGCKASVRIIGRVSQRAQFTLHHRLRHHRTNGAPLRVDVLVDQR
jgi:hypothetical protein